jgi:hypothetical protein
VSTEQNIARRLLWISGFAAGTAAVQLQQHNFGLGAAMAAASVTQYVLAKMYERESRKATKEGEP